jgi:transposase-like protein
MADVPVKKRSFDAAFKLKVVEYAAMNTNRGAATKFSVNEKQVRQWRMKKEDLKELPKKKKRMDSGGRKPRLPDVERVLLAWIDELRAGNLRITCSGIQRKATELARSEGDTKFIASRGWLQKFFKGHQLSLRRKTTVSQKLPRDLIPQVLFLRYQMLYVAPLITQVVGFIIKTRKL